MHFIIKKFNLESIELIKKYKRGLKQNPTNNTQNQYNKNKIKKFVEKTIRIIKLIFEKPIEINQQNYKGNTPLILSVLSKNPMIFDLIYAHEPDITIKNYLGATAYDIAKKLQFTHGIEKLESHKAMFPNKKQQ